MTKPRIVDCDRVAMRGRIARAVELTQQGRTASEIAAALGVTTRSVQRYRRNAGASKPPPAFRWTPEAEEAALRLIDDGAPVTEIARTIGAGRTTVSRRYPHAAWGKRECGALGRSVMAAA